jgi:hypothetical protein
LSDVASDSFETFSNVCRCVLPAAMNKSRALRGGVLVATSCGSMKFAQSPQEVGFGGTLLAVENKDGIRAAGIKRGEQERDN